MFGNNKKKEEVYDKLLDIAKAVSNNKEGALFVIAKSKKLKNLYEVLYPQIISSVSIFNKGSKELILKLSELDGAFLIDNNGIIIAFGARIKKSKTLAGFGTKHAAAVGITEHIKHSVAILVSEESGWIKVFKDGKLIIEIDPTKNTPPSIMHKVISFITDNDTALLATAGASAAIMGVIPVVVVSGTYLAIKTTSNIIKRSLKH